MKSGGEDLTSKYTFDPYLGFILSNQSFPPDFSSLTCYLNFRSKTESLQFMVHSQQLVASDSATIPVTLQTVEEVVEGWGDIVVDCKAEVNEGEVEVEWEVPALPFHRLPFSFLLFFACLFHHRIHPGEATVRITERFDVQEVNILTLHIQSSAFYSQQDFDLKKKNSRLCNLVMVCH